MSAREPLMHGDYATKTKVGWRFRIQRQNTNGGSWNTIFTSGYQTAKASNSIPAYGSRPWLLTQVVDGAVEPKRLPLPDRARSQVVEAERQRRRHSEPEVRLVQARAQGRRHGRAAEQLHSGFLRTRVIFLHQGARPKGRASFLCENACPATGHARLGVRQEEIP